MATRAIVVFTARGVNGVFPVASTSQPITITGEQSAADIEEALRRQMIGEDTSVRVYILPSGVEVGN